MKRLDGGPWRIVLSRSLSLLLSLLLLSGMGFGSPEALAAEVGGGPPRSEHGVWIGPGVTFETFSWSQGAVRGGIVRIDPIWNERDGVGPEVLLSVPQDRLATRQTVRAQAEAFGRHAVAGINGDFFYQLPHAPGVTLGVVIRDGILLSSWSGPSVGVDKQGRPFIGNLRWRGVVQVLGEDGEVLAERTLCAVNKPRTADCLILFTPDWGPTTRTNVWGIEAVVVPEGAPVELTPEGVFEARIRSVDLPQGGERSGGDTPLTPGIWVLSGHGRGEEFLAAHARPDVRLRFLFDISEPWGDMVHVMGAGHRLIEDGKPVPLPGDALVTRREPRTAVGIDHRGRWVWLVVDGRREGWSRGMTLPEMTEFLLELGVQEAVNLDGGGSSTLWVRPPGEMTGDVANRPSGGERAVGPSWLVVSRRQPGPAAYLWLDPTESRVLPRTPVSFRLLAQDEAHDPVAVASPSTWSLEPLEGADDVSAEVEEIPGGLRITPGLPGTARLIVKLEDAEAVGRLQVAGPDDIARLEIHPDPATLHPGQEVAFSARAYDAQGQPLPSGPETFRWSGTGGFAGMDASGTIRLPEEYAEGTVQVALRMITRDGAEVEVPLQSFRVQVGDPPMFSDVLGHWAVSEIAALAQRGWVRGYPDGTFRPDRQVTRAELVVLLWRIWGTGEFSTSDAFVTPPFVDADAIGDWSAPAVTEAANRHWVAGYEDGTFRPQRAVTRQELAALLTRIPALQIEPGASAPFADDASIAEWARNAVVAVRAAGLIDGYPDGTFRPDRPVTRAELVTILSRAATP